MKLLLSVFLFLILTATSWAQNSLSLEECRQLALENNKSLQAAAYDLEAATLQAGSARKHFFPKLFAEGGYMRRNKQYQLFDGDMFLPVISPEGIDQETGQFNPAVLQDPDLALDMLVINPETGQPFTDADGNPLFQRYAWLPEEEGKIGANDNYQFGVMLEQPIYMGGRIRSSHRMASAGERIARESKRLTEAEVIGKTDTRFWQVVSMQEKLELTQVWLEMLDHFVDDLKRLLDEGMVTQNQLLEAKVKRNEVRLKEMQANNGLRLSRMALAQITGMPLAEEFSLDPDFSPLSHAGEQGEMISMAMDQRPEVHMLKESTGIHLEKENIARSRMLPTVGLAGGYTYMNPNPYSGFSSEFGGDWHVGVSVKIPIYHFGEKRTQLAKSRVETKRSEVVLADAREKIELEVTRSLYTYEEAAARVDFAEMSLDQATENLRMTRHLFDEGRAATRDVLEAQALWQGAYQAHISAKNQQRVAYTELLKASGELSGREKKK